MYISPKSCLVEISAAPDSILTFVGGGGGGGGGGGSSMFVS